MKLSRFGRLLAQDSPIIQLMEDLGEALGRNPDLLFLGGGNPAQVPAAQQCFQRHLQALAQDPQAASAMLGVYPPPQGGDSTLRAVAGFLSRECSWPVTEANIALVNGSQLAFFILFNLLAGTGDNDDSRRVLLPLVPEYLGYGAQGLTDDFFATRKPLLQYTGEHRFKYALDNANLKIDGDIGALCVSRPTNPSGNLLSASELDQLLALAQQAGIPLLVDLAYGSPFPGIVYQAADNPWRSGAVHVLSLSKLGLPGVRTAIVVGDEALIRCVTRANTIMSLANSNLGPALLERLIDSGDLARLGQSVLPDFYRVRRDYLLDLLDRELRGVPYRIHEAQGAFFVWLWLEGLPGGAQALYEKLKKQGVLLMAGEPFFFGWQESWDHARECLRLTYCQPPEVLERAVVVIAREVKGLYTS